MGGSRGTTEPIDAACTGESPGGVRAARASMRSRRPARRLLVSVLALLALLLTAGSALAAGASEHSFSRAFKAEGECTFTAPPPPEEPNKETGPGVIAVNEATGDVYVFDRGNNSVDRFDSSGNCLKHVELATGGKPGNIKFEGLAVDNSSGPSKGDVYVVAGFKKSVRKFNAALDTPALGEFKEPEAGVEFVEIHGIGVDGSGNLYVYDGKGTFGASEAVIYKFDGAVTNEFIESIPASGTCPPQKGFAVGPGGETFYVARKRENTSEKCENATVMYKIDAEGNPVGEQLEPQIDNTDTTGAAADQSTGEVYFDHATSVSAFTPTGEFVDRFGNEGGPGQLTQGTGVASDSALDEVYVVDGGEVKIYAPSGPLTPEFPLPVALADGREWEQVTPQNKLGAQLYGINKGLGIVEASADGNALTYLSSTPITPHPPTSRAPEPTQNVARRGSTSWNTEDVIAPSGRVPAGYRAGSGTQYESFAEDLSAGIIDLFPHMANPATEPLLAPEATEDTTYRRTLTGSSPSCEPIPSTCYQALVSPLNSNSGQPFGTKVHLTGATGDLQHAVVMGEVPLNAEALAVEQEAGLYEWSAGGQLELISLPPAPIEGKKETPIPVNEGLELRLGGPGQGYGGDMRNAISTNGTRVVWSTTRGEGRLFLRDTTKHETLRLDKYQGVPETKEKIVGGACEERCAQAQYQTADKSDTRIFFTDYNRLTADSSQLSGESALEEEEKSGLGDLYVCEIVETAGKLGCSITDLTAATGIRPTNEPARVQGVIGASDDGSTIYFVADGQLAPNSGPGGCVPREGAARAEEQEGKLPVFKCTVYVTHRGAEGWETPKVVATVTTQDEADWLLSPSAGSLTQVTSRVSPDGNWLAFMSNRSLTGYDNRDITSDPEGTTPETVRADEEVYLYDGSGQHVSCVSCNPAGARPAGVFDQFASGEGLGLLIDRSEAWTKHWLAADIPGWTNRSKESAVNQSRYLSNSGRLFFNSADTLVPADKSAKADVYEFEPNGVGTCVSSTGCVSLLSSGISGNESAFIDASTNGDDVFFITSAKMLPSDEDTGFDIYDARVCGEAGCIKPPGAPPPPCTGEVQCKGAPATVPAAPPVPASTLGGSGNAGKTSVLSETKKGGGKHLTRAQKLKKALKACKKIKKKSKRKSCEKKARKKYGPVKKKAKK